MHPVSKIAVNPATIHRLIFLSFPDHPKDTFLSYHKNISVQSQNLPAISDGFSPRFLGVPFGTA
jgi:hypothetical protein